MELNLPRLRLGLACAGIVLLIAWKVFGGSTGPEPGILIEFGSDPERFAGLAVEVDGRVVGTLERIGQATRTAFPVEPGEHTVLVRDPELPCAPARVTVADGGIKATLLLEHDEGADASGRLRGGLVLH